VKHIRIIGLCLVAVFAIAAAAASTASAGVPEFGQCFAKAGGKFANSNCTTKAAKGTGTFEWRKLPEVKESKRFTGAGGTGVLSGRYEACVRGNKDAACSEEQLEKEEAQVLEASVECERETASGEETGTKEVKNVAVKFVGCKLFGSTPCSNSSVEGEINVNALKGKLGYIDKATKEVGVQLEPVTKKGEFAKFVCAGFITTVVGVDANSKTEALPAYSGTGRDGIISPITPVNQMTHELTQVYTVNSEHENVPSKFEGKPAELLESYVENNNELQFRSAWSKAGETITNVNTSETEGEIKA
jgi:hypothetical protein